MIRLIHPVEFGHSVHDPVWLVFGLGASWWNIFGCCSA